MQSTRALLQLTCTNDHFLFAFRSSVFGQSHDDRFRSKRHLSPLTFRIGINMFLHLSEHAMQAPRDRIARCRVYRSACPRRVHLSRRGERPSTIVEFVLEDSRSSSRFGIDAAASWGNSQCNCHQSKSQRLKWSLIAFNSFTVSSSTKFGSIWRQNSIESSSKLHWQAGRRSFVPTGRFSATPSQQHA